MELLNIPFTGSSAATLMATMDKHLMKLALESWVLKTPRAFLFSGEETVTFSLMRFPVILKPLRQDARIGIDQESVITDPGILVTTLRQFHKMYGPIIVKEFIEGREFMYLC